MTRIKQCVLAMLLGGVCCVSCAEADLESDPGTTPTDGEDSTTTEAPTDSEVKSDSGSDTDVGTTTQASSDTPSDTGSEDVSPTDTASSTDTNCALDEGVYNYCNKSKPCSCDNLCGKAIMESSSMIGYKPIGSMCLAECEIGKANDCPHEWEECGKMKDSDPQAFCMPMGTVSGTWQARVFESTVDLSDEVTVAEKYLMANDDVTVDVGWWQPEPTFTKGMVAFGDPSGTGEKYYILTLLPPSTIKYGNTIDSWMFEVYIPEDNWHAATLKLSGNPGAFLVQPMLLRIVTPTVSMRTWMHGAVRTTSTFTINNPGELCTNLDNTEACAVASGSFKIDLFGLSGTIEEQ